MWLHASRFQIASLGLLLFSSRYASGLANTARTSIIDPSATVNDAQATYGHLDTLNANVDPILSDLLKQDFFAYYRLNLYNKECPFWNDESSLCGNRACAVDTIEDESQIPEMWRVEELSKLQGAHAQHPGPRLQKERSKKRPLQYQLGEDVDESCVLEDDDECDERDYCIPEDEGASSKGDYVSLLNNTERFTGYMGPGARMVWDAVYKENCFTKTSTSSPLSHATPGALHAAADLRNIFQNAQDPSLDESANLDDQCIEQRAFHRIISGMHASISSHLCWDYFNQTTGEWVRNVNCYVDRLHSHPERVRNLYFNYALVSRAIAKLLKPLSHYTFCSGDPEVDFETQQSVLALTSHLASQPKTFDENVMFTNPDLLDLKDDFKQRFRNVSRIMDCVGCDKCRLWGKLQTAGYGAALKVLFEFDETKNGENPHLRRTELVALVNTFGRLSHSMEATRQFRNIVEGRSTTAAAEQPLQTGHIQKPLLAPKRPSIPESSDKDLDQESLVPRQPVRRSREQLTVWEDIKAECNLVWRAYIMVLRSWINLPFKLSGIAILELNRAWSYFLGLPVPGRSWTLDWDHLGGLHRDEL